MPVSLDRQGSPSADDVVAEIGLFIVIVVGIAVAINAALVVLHVSA